MRRFWLRAFVPMLPVSVLVAAVSGCSGEPRRMSPAEANAYKLELVQEHQGELTEAQKDRFMSSFLFGPTRAELDAAMAAEVERFRRKERTDRARLEEARNEQLSKKGPSEAEPSEETAAANEAGPDQ